MESLTALLDKLCRHQFDIDSEHWVYVTHIIDPYTFYVRLVEYDSYMPILGIKGDPIDEMEIHIRSEVVYKSITIKSYVRGQVCFINSDKTFDIFAHDYGCVDKKVPLKYIRQPFYNHQTPALAVLCSLIYCSPVEGSEWSQDSVDAMKEYVKQERAKLIVRNIVPNKLHVELYNTCPDEIGTLLVKTAFAHFGMLHQDISRLPVLSPLQFYYKYKKHVIGEVLHVRHLKGRKPDDFFVSKIGAYNKYFESRNDLNSYVIFQKSINMHDIKVDLPVAVQSNIDLKYERAIITSVNHQKSSAEVFLVDNGMKLSLSMSRIKPLNKEMFFVSPPIAIYCTIDESSLTYSQHSYFLPGYEYLVKIKEVGDTFKKPYVVEIKSLPKKFQRFSQQDTDI